MEEATLTDDNPATTLGGALAVLLASGSACMGEVALRRNGSGGYRLCHRDDAERPSAELEGWSRPEDAEELARYDDAGAYRPLKTAPNLRHGWRLELDTPAALRLALDCLYPGRFAAFLRWRQGNLEATPLRETLGRQTGMYRVTQKITDEEAAGLIGRFCRSDGGCARTILWHLAPAGEDPVRRVLPPEKFDAGYDQVRAGEPGAQPVSAQGDVLPLLCQEACNLLVAEARGVVKGRKAG